MPSSLSFSAILAHAARAHPERPALIHGDRRITHAVFNKRVNRLANGLLGAGLAPGDTVAASMPACVEMLEIYWGAAKAGLTLIPMNAMLQAPEIAGIFQLAGVRCALASRELLERLPPSCTRLDLVIDPGGYPDSYEALLSDASEAEPDLQIDPESACTIMFSSGTTSRPKGIVNSHRARAAACHIYAVEFGLTFESRTLLATPLYHNSALIMALPTLAVGGCVVLEDKFDPASAARAWHAHAVTHALLVPTQLRRMLSDSRIQTPLPDSTQCLVTVGEPLPETVRTETLRRLTPNLYTMYGISEGLATVLRPERQVCHPGSVGTPVLYTDIRIVDETGAALPTGAIGEIIGRSARMMSGYFCDQPATDAALVDEWLHTGDLGRLDADGLLYVVGRKKEMIISGGVNIYPVDIEMTIAGHPDVQEAAVVGVPDERWGEIVKLVAVPRPGSDLTPQALDEWCRSNLPGYQRPKAIEFRTQLPRNATGKVIKPLLTGADPALPLSR
ncbi:hypothetical protein EGT29_08945 [Pigmentiphaga sp. H8]|uniref:class I adenylate-forming enzyme family protein n=1 Tax=Pigmentiphaga sp. H8 TaxID=2488560 RepID=UPI000F58F411|nr:AMP-binding protein [Pigmentiphaga sp. H8]AZG07995.1 hypothetical protein EGT29_08945 [Pigmentiphaga sp. H8]